MCGDGMGSRLLAERLVVRMIVVCVFHVYGVKVMFPSVDWDVGCSIILPRLGR